VRIQIFIRNDLAEVLNDLAWQENRWPKQQAEWLLQKALEKVAPSVRAAAQSHHDDNNGVARGE
jgi:hypothetical protein